VSYLRRLTKIALTAVAETEKIMSEAAKEVADLTSKIATEVEKTESK
jgi:hypothetical protein